MNPHPASAGGAACYPSDAGNVAPLVGRTVAVIGFGNQGHAHALNLRDSGIDTVIGNRGDDYVDRARQLGFEPLSIEDASARADVLALLVPDDVQAAVFAEHVAPSLRPGATVVVASGYAVYHGLLPIRAGTDVVMVAPRMVGANVRSRYLAGAGSPAFLSVEIDGSGEAERLAVAYAEAIGCTRGGCFASSAREEVALDLFGEQALWPAVIGLFETAYEILADAGFSDAAIIHELYLSGEPAEILQNAAALGLLEQLRLHSPASQLGQLGPALPDDIIASVRDRFSAVLHQEVLGGSFAQRWQDRAAVDGELRRLYAVVGERPMHRAERRVREQLSTRTTEETR